MNLLRGLNIYEIISMTAKEDKVYACVLTYTDSNDQIIDEDFIIKSINTGVIHVSKSFEECKDYLEWLVSDYCSECAKGGIIFDLDPDIYNVKEYTIDENGSLKIL